MRAAAAHTTVPLILVLCPSAVQLDDVVRRGVADLPSVYLLTASEIAALYPVAEVHDPHGNELGRVPYTPLYFVALATALARKIHAIVAPQFKVVALDCDDTLWAGICGEDGPEGVVLDPPRRALQQFMAERRRDGLLLALCSKNNEEDVAATFRAHPDMPLAPGDFVAQRVNWDPKPGNLASLAEELELGLDTFILIDDNPKEVQEVQAGAPQVLALLLPARAAEIPDFLAHVWAFDRARVTDEDRRRGEMYAQRAERARAARTSPSLEDFLASLQLEVTHRTHAARAGGPRRPTHAAHQPDECHLHTPHRGGNPAPVRGVPDGPRHRSLRQLRPHRRDHFSRIGVGARRGHVPAELPRVGPRRGTSHGGASAGNRRGARASSSWRSRSWPHSAIAPRCSSWNRSARSPPMESSVCLPAERPPAARYHPRTRTARRTASARTCEDRAAAARADYARIANDLRTPEQISSAMRAAARRRVPQRAIDAPRTALERDLVALWAELLNVEAVGIHENFFELGGHSLLAVQLLSRVRQIYGVDLSLEVVYSGEFMVAELAKAIELKEIEQAGGDYHELIQELEGLSDAEVRALLAEEQDAT